MESYIRPIVAMLLICSSLLLVLGPLVPKVQAFPPRGPITISSNSGFTSANGVIGGSGTAYDPFIIGNFEIIVNTTAGIHIKGGGPAFVTAYFVIRNVLIHPPNMTAQSSGIWFDNVQKGLVENVTIVNFTTGVQLSGGSADEVLNSTMRGNTDGILVSGTIGATISGNHVYNNTRFGISVNNSSESTFTRNNASLNGNQTGGPFQNTNGAGFQVTGSNNLFEDNNATGNLWFGIKMAGSPTTASTNNTFRNNLIHNNGNATGGGGLVLINNSSGNLIIGNNVTSQNDCLGLEWQPGQTQDSYNNITQNRVVGCAYAGIYLDNATYNVIYNNYLSNPGSNAKDDTLLNSWNVTKTLRRNILGGPFVGGNFYADYSGSDPDSDGIGDTPYSITNTTMTHPNHDLLPLVLSQPSVVHDVAVRGINSISNPARAGASVSLAIVAFNQGTVSESFSVSATFSPQASPSQITVISTVSISNLPAWSGMTLSMSWSTLSLGVGAYTLVANASTVPGETYTVNNKSPPTTVNLTLNQPPLASFAVNILSPSAGQMVTLDGTASHDPDGTVVSYAWNFGDGTPTGSAAVMSHSWMLAGSYVVNLTVTDNEGATGYYARAVTVRAIPPGAPTNLQLSTASGKTTLTWTAPSNIGGSLLSKYLIYRATSQSGTWTNVANTTDTSYIDTSVADGQTYYYQVQAVNQAGLASQPSSTQSVLVPASQGSLVLWLIISGAIIAAAAGAVAVVLRKRSKTRSISSSASQEEA